MAANFGLRRFVLTLAAAQTAFWLYLVVGGLNEALPFARGYGAFAALLGTLVYVAFALPALVLAALGRGLQLAAWLAAIAAVLYLYDPLLRVSAALDGIPFLGLYVLGALGAVLLLGYRAARGAG